MNLPSLSSGEKLAVGGGVLALVGSFLPWLDEMALLGVESDGFLTFAFAVSVLGIVALWDWLVVQQLVVGLLGVLVTMVAGNWALPNGVATGVGVYVVLGAGVLIFYGAVIGVVRSLREAVESPEELSGVE